MISLAPTALQMKHMEILMEETLAALMTSAEGVTLSTVTKDNYRK